MQEAWRYRTWPRRTCSQRDVDTRPEISGDRDGNHQTRCVECRSSPHRENVRDRYCPVGVGSIEQFAGKVLAERRSDLSHQIRRLYPHGARFRRNLNVDGFARNAVNDERHTEGHWGPRWACPRLQN